MSKIYNIAASTNGQSVLILQTDTDTGAALRMRIDNADATVVGQAMTEASTDIMYNRSVEDGQFTDGAE